MLPLVCGVLFCFQFGEPLGYVIFLFIHHIYEYSQLSRKRTPSGNEKSVR